MLKDRYGYVLTTTSAEARDHYVHGIDLLLAAEAGVEAALVAATEADPDFALAHLALSRQHQLFGRIEGAVSSSTAARQLAAKTTVREQQQIGIYVSLFNKDLATSRKLTNEHMKDYPRDAFALAPATGPFSSYGFSGLPNWEELQLALLESVVDAFGDDWWFRTAHAFALVEAGQWKRGRRMADEVLQLRPTNCHAAHTMAHALFEAGDDQDAKDFMGGFLATASRDSMLHCHNSWHHAMALMATGEEQAGYEFLQDNCMPGSTSSPSINVLTDSIAFLWRAELNGASRKRELWASLSDYYDVAFGGRPFVFVDAHIGLVYAALGEKEKLDACIAALEKAGREGALPAGTTAADITRAYKAFALEDWSKAIECFEPLMNSVARIGSSKAQRDLVKNTLIAAYVKDDRREDAIAFIGSDALRQPSRPIAHLNAK